MLAVPPYLATLCLGAMTFFSFVFAPLVFSRLPPAQAGQFIRVAFPRYYTVLGALTGTGAAAGLWYGAPGGWLMLAVAAGFAISLRVLMPAINAARDRDTAGDTAARPRFRRLHLVSVILNLAQMALLGYVSLELFA